LTVGFCNNSDAWKKETFKPYNFNTMGLAVGGGHLHPLMKVRAEFRRVLMDMGYVSQSLTVVLFSLGFSMGLMLFPVPVSFQEMPTNRYVESSFWNFDSLFQPQSHPARDAHDTFFLTSTFASSSHTFPTSPGKLTLSFC
jgi:phenylalanyl-tRNA synthetase alpha chain